MSDPQILHIELNEQFPCLKRAPIVEAVIHWAVPSPCQIEQDRLHDQLATQLLEYSDRKPVRAFRIATHISNEGVATSSNDESWEGWRLASADGRNVAQFNVDSFVFSRLAPYESWQAFVAEALRLWTIYAAIVKPPEVHRLGVRYINRIAPVTIAGVETLLSRPPVRLKTLGLPVREFLYQSSHDVPGYDYQLNVVDTIQANMQSEEGLALILDLDAFTTRPVNLDTVQMRDHLDRLRWLKNKAFFTLVQPMVIQQFEPEAT